MSELKQYQNQHVCYANASPDNPKLNIQIHASKTYTLLYKNTHIYKLWNQIERM